MSAPAETAAQHELRRAALALCNELKDAPTNTLNLAKARAEDGLELCKLDVVGSDPINELPAQEELREASTALVTELTDQALTTYALAITRMSAAIEAVEAELYPA